MAKNNACDILTCDWNPIIGCERYSPGCRHCWFLDGIFEWQQRLGNIPDNVLSNQHYVFQDRLNAEYLRKKTGIVGVIQHGDLFWDKVPDDIIHQILETIDQAYHKSKNHLTKYVLWTKRAERMVHLLNTKYYIHNVPAYLGCGVAIEDQKTAEERLPHLLQLNGKKFIMIEPMLGPIDLSAYTAVDWIVVGSETGKDARSINRDWVRSIRDHAKSNNIPFFIKQLNNDHKQPVRTLDNTTWDQFPAGYIK